MLCGTKTPKSYEDPYPTDHLSKRTIKFSLCKLAFLLFLYQHVSFFSTQMEQLKNLIRIVDNKRNEEEMGKEVCNLGEGLK